MKTIKEFFKPVEDKVELVLDKRKKKTNPKIKGSQAFVFHGWVTETQFKEFLKAFEVHKAAAILSCGFIRKKGFMLRNFADENREVPFEISDETVAAEETKAALRAKNKNQAAETKAAAEAKAKENNQSDRKSKK